MCLLVFFFFKQKTAYEMRISDWSSDVCSSDLLKLSTSLPNARLALFSGDAWRIGGVVFANVLHLDDACIRDRLIRSIEPPAFHRAAALACGIEPVGHAGIPPCNCRTVTSYLVQAPLCTASHRRGHV